MAADAGNRGTGKRRLARYRDKRDFHRTAEPSDRARASRGKRSGAGSVQKLIFVIQKHAARRLHWDLRLEWKGTLRSWAVPKGPSLDPDDKRLAVEVEDHPIAYAKFAGDIPQGQYGAGHVDLWDNGTWAPVEDFEKGLAKGHLSFELFGQKLAGRWHLVRTRMQGKQTQWLLMKSRDAAARAGATADVIDAGGTVAGAPPRAQKPAPAPAPAKRAGRRSTSMRAPGVKPRAPKPRSRRSRGTSGQALPPTINTSVVVRSTASSPRQSAHAIASGLMIARLSGNASGGGTWCRSYAGWAIRMSRAATIVAI